MSPIDSSLLPTPLLDFSCHSEVDSVKGYRFVQLYKIILPHLDWIMHHHLIVFIVECCFALFAICSFDSMSFFSMTPILIDGVA